MKMKLLIMLSIYVNSFFLFNIIRHILYTNFILLSQSHHFFSLEHMNKVSPNKKHNIIITYIKNLI